MDVLLNIFLLASWHANFSLAGMPDSSDKFLQMTCPKYLQVDKV